MKTKDNLNNIITCVMFILITIIKERKICEIIEGK